MGPAGPSAWAYYCRELVLETLPEAPEVGYELEGFARALGATAAMTCKMNVLAGAGNARNAD